MSVFGVDLGSKNSCVAVTRHGGVDIIMNEVSKRETSSFVSLGDEERYIGEAGLDKAVRNAQNTVSCIKRFIGMRADDPRLQEELKYVFTPTSADENGKLMFDLNYDGETRSYYPEQVLAMLLTQLRKYVVKETGNDKAKDVVVTVPTWYNAHQRKLTEQACEIAGLNCMSLINETTAACVDYGIFRGTSLPDSEEKGTVVCILDIGFSETKLTIATFWKGHMKVLAQGYDMNLGSRAIDLLLTEHFSQEIDKKYKINPMENRRAKIRLMQACDKLKCMLSANAVAPLNIEMLMNEIDVNFPTVQRELLEQIITPFADRLSVLCNNTIQKAELGDRTIHSVECIGGGVRVPLLKARIAEAFKVEQCSFTLNMTESIARGCAITAAVFSPLFQVREFVVNEKHTLPICLAYHSETAQAQSQISFLPQVNKVVTILRETEYYPKTLELSFNRTDAFDLYAVYDENSPLVQEHAILGVGHNLLIGRWMIGSTSKKTNGEVKVRIKFHASGAVTIDAAWTQEVYEVEETVTVKAEDKPAEKPAETTEADPDAIPKDENSPKEAPKEEKQTVKKTKHRKVDLTVTPDLTAIGLPGDVLVKLVKNEEAMHQRDLKIQRTKEAKNDLESYIYDNRSRVEEGGNLREFVAPDSRAEFKKLADEFEQWLYDDGYEATFEEYQKRLIQLQLIGTPAMKRKALREDFPFAHNIWVPKMQAIRQTATDKIGKAAHITEEELHAAEAKVDEALAWASGIVQQLAESPKHEDVKVKVEELDAKLSGIEKEVKAVVNKKPPPPPKKEEKKDEKKEEPAAAADGTAPPPPPPEDNSGPQAPTDVD